MFIYIYFFNELTSNLEKGVKIFYRVEKSREGVKYSSWRETK
jgi:hypothetical protein